MTSTNDQSVMDIQKGPRLIDNRLSLMENRSTHRLGYKKKELKPSHLSECQRLALKCTELEIEVHPVSQLIQESPWNKELVKIIQVDKPVQWVLCIGYSKKHFKQGPRRPVTDFSFLPPAARGSF